MSDFDVAVVSEPDFHEESGNMLKRIAVEQMLKIGALDADTLVAAVTAIDKLVDASRKHEDAK